MTTLMTCSDCGARKVSVLFGWNNRTHSRNAYCKACGRVRKSARSFKAPSKVAWYRRPKLEGSILGK